LSTPLALWVGGRQVIAGELPIGDLAKVVLYLMAIGHRVGMVGQFTNILQNASASAERILEIIHEPNVTPSGTRPMPEGKGEVRFENVGFEYTDKRAALNDVSFVAPAGQMMAIVGPTAAGKTTLVNLIPRFYDPSKGRILLDGIDIREIALDQLRRQVGVIFQETFLFSTSARENIAYGKPQATPEEIEAAARAAQAHDFITELADGYDTIIGERGISLSGGQRQRIAIARAFLMNPRLLLLDDATASVDSQTERQIQEAMRQLCAHRTSFVIAHRLSTVKHADHILVLDQGRVVERGTHASLLEGGGLYRQIFRSIAREELAT
jgi:ABC-type multidrug transport system fused ATPase/permease subunit